VLGIDAGCANDPELAAAADRLSRAGVEVTLNASGDVRVLGQARTLIKSPGVPQRAQVVVAARDRGIPILGELELAWRLLPNEFVAVTGTNGKTTTTEWIGHIHRTAGVAVAVAGNVGTAASSLVGQVDREAVVVCEASSFQLEDTALFAPEVALLLNLSPDHLDRHGSFENYRLAKMRVFDGQDEQGLAVMPEGFSLPVRARVIHYGQGPEAELAAEIQLPGDHNRQNGMAAAAVCLARGIESEAVAAGLRTFRGVAHRLEQIAEIDGVAWINDSKATNVASTLVALRAFASGVHLIAGGRAKGQDFSPLAPLVAQRCKAVYLVGEAASQISRALGATGVPLHDLGALEGAVAAARADARPGDTVLLSPACASYDQFRDFEERGERFRVLVEGG